MPPFSKYTCWAWCMCSGHIWGEVRYCREKPWSFYTEKHSASINEGTSPCFKRHFLVIHSYLSPQCPVHAHNFAHKSRTQPQKDTVQVLAPCLKQARKVGNKQRRIQHTRVSPVGRQLTQTSLPFTILPGEFYFIAFNNHTALSQRVIPLFTDRRPPSTPEKTMFSELLRIYPESRLLVNWFAKGQPLSNN